jgi:hypothetical protein
VTGWAASGGSRSELVPVLGLSGEDEPTGVTAAGPTLFAVLARLTAETDPVPLADLVSVRPSGNGEVDVRWSSGRRLRVRPTRDCPVVDTSAGAERIRP